MPGGAILREGERPGGGAQWRFAVGHKGGRRVSIALPRQRKGLISDSLYGGVL